MSALQKIAEIEAEMERTQKNKATNSHLGALRAKLSKLKAEVLLGDKAAGAGGGEGGFDVTKSGDTRVGLVGFPSVGKSTLLTTLTGTESEAAEYAFTTLTAIPGTLNYRGAKIQVLDLPGIIEGARDGKGRGRQIIGTARTCNVILIVLDAARPLTYKNKIEKELEGFHIRLNKSPPNLSFTKKDKGGIAFNTTMKSRPINLNEDVAKAILKEYKIHNADIVLHEDCTDQDLIDVIENKCVYMPTLYVLNKIDSVTVEELDILDKVPNVVLISAKDEWNLDELLDRIWEECHMIRLYTKPLGQVPDLTAPVILHAQNPTVGAFCDRIHKNIKQYFKYALVWGKSVKHSPQKCGLSHVLMDEDVVQIVKNA